MNEYSMNKDGIILFSEGERPGRYLKFGKYKGKTIEQMHFINYGYLNWAMKQNNLSWIETYVQEMPKIFPNKIKIKCNGPNGCHKRTATRFTVSVDEHCIMIMTLGNAYFWCDHCDENSHISWHPSFAEFSLDFTSCVLFNRNDNRNGFYKILKHVYGVKTLTAKVAFDLFWE